MINVRRGRLFGILALSVQLFGVGLLLAPTVEAASWSSKYTVTASSCPSSGAYPIAGAIWFADYFDGSCKSNGTTTSSDPDLRNDTWKNGAPMAPGFNYVGQSIAPGQSVTIWQSTACSASGASQTVTSSFTTSVNYYSFKRNSSSSGC